MSYVACFSHRALVKRIVQLGNPHYRYAKMESAFWPNSSVKQSRSMRNGLLKPIAPFSVLKQVFFGRL